MLENEDSEESSKDAILGLLPLLLRAHDVVPLAAVV